MLQSPLQTTTQEVKIDSLRDDFGVLKILSTGICAADGYLYSGKHPWSIEYPIIPGHEIFGEIVELNSSAKDSFCIGDQVTLQVLIPCYLCEPCLNQRFNLCLKACHFGSCERGGFADFIRIPQGARVHKFEEKVDSEIGALAETFANAFFCLDLANPLPNAKVLIMGLGSIGMSIAHIVSERYPQLDLWGLTSSAWKRSMFEQLGGRCINGLNDSSERFTNSFDVVIECSGFESNLEFGLDAIKPGGRFIQYGVFRDKVSIDFNVFAEFKSINLLGGHLANDDAFEKATVFLGRNADRVRKIISQRVSFNDFSDAFHPTNRQKIKTIFVPEGMSR